MFELPKEKFVSIFLDEAREIVEALENDLLELENNHHDEALINKIFRSIHTIKGSAGTVGLDGMRDFTHTAENLLEKVRSGKIEISSEIIDVCLKYLDITKLMIENIAANAGEEDYSSISGIDETTNEFKKLMGAETSAVEEKAKEGTPSEETSAKKYELNLVFKENIFEHGIDPLMFIRELESKGEIKKLVTHTEKIPNIKEIDLFKCYVSFEIEYETELGYNEVSDIFIFVLDDNDIEIKERSKGASPSKEEEMDAEVKAEEADDESLGVQNENEISEEETADEEDERKEEDADSKKAPSSSPARQAKSAVAKTVRVDTGKLDSMMNLVGELVIAQSRIMQLVKQLDITESNELDGAVNSLDRITREIQEEVMNIRMMPIAPIFLQFQRFVRDVSQEMGKDIVLELKGEQTEIDKNMLEQLSDPLKHIIRNAIDHGIEAPDERVDHNKERQGTITLSAFHQEGHVVIEIKDDGHGLNKDKILKKAIDKGILKADVEYSDNEVFNTIFLPGFSTADKVTDISGRGVGMDVVRVNIEKLKGRIEISSVYGEGTTFRLRLPLTLAIIEGITFSLGNNIFVMPLLSIIENMKIKESDIRSIEGKDEMVNVRGEYCPLIRLHKMFKTDVKSASIDEGIVVLAEAGYRKLAVFVDELLDQQQVVIKSLDPAFKKHPGIAGGTILGDGRIALIIDVPGLVNSHEKSAEEKSKDDVRESVKGE